ncbi:DUF397 domain-containing protein [Streptomyces noursei]|uniref:DUF397 domain-containing protein n=1 Tax=Streptomyces noursei TaxID=1971 RepID=UPI000D128BC6|nr:DUF397 domain-containing protein [Streptomyces noursei]
MIQEQYSSGEGGECVEVAAAHGTVHVRDLKRPADAMVTVSPAGVGRTGRPGRDRPQRLTRCTA